jgi:hypothetical protein
MGRGIALLVLVASCSEPPGAGPPDAAIPDPAPPIGGVDPTRASDDLLFSLDYLPELQLTLTPAAIASLREEPRSWACGHLGLGEHTYPIGVRLKGAASFQSIDRKPALKIRFDGPCGGDRRFFGRTALTLNNLVQDRSSLRELLGYLVFRTAGVPSPRTGYARLEINGKPYGLYVDLETVDDDFLARHFGDPSGPLYEGTLEVDLRPDDLWSFELDEGDSPERAELAALIDRAQAPGDSIFYGPEPLIDRDAFVRFLAASAVTGDWDGYWKPNNYRLYYEPTARLWYFLPWGLDQVWLLDRTAFDGVGLLIEKCMSSRRCLREYLAELERVTALAGVLDLDETMARAIALVGDDVAADPRRPYPIEEVAWARRALPVRIETTLARIRTQVGCLGDDDQPDDESLDADGDGAVACREDCDDGDPSRRPGSGELCDGIDHDCDGMVNDAAWCECPELMVGQVRFSLCTTARTWQSARASCQEAGGDLAWIDDQEQNFALWRAAKPSFARHWLIGLNDLAVEDEYRWADGRAPSFLNWHWPEPNNIGEEDCGEIGGQADAGWNDINCATARPYLCRLEAPR